MRVLKFFQIPVRDRVVKQDTGHPAEDRRQWCSLPGKLQPEHSRLLSTQKLHKISTMEKI